MAFFQDIAEKFGLLPELAKTTIGAVKAKATQLETEKKLKEVQTAKKKEPITGVSFGGFFGDIAEKFNLAKPQEFVKEKPKPISPIGIPTGTQVLGQIGKKVGEVAGGLVGLEPQEVFKAETYKTLIKETPRAISEVAKELVTHPEKAIYGVARGISDFTTNAMVNILDIGLSQKTKEKIGINEQTIGEVQKILDKYLPIEEKPGIAQGFRQAGGVVPLMTAGAIGGKLAGGVGNIAGFVGAGQTQLPASATVEQRAEQVVNDLVALGVLSVGSIAYKQAKNKAIEYYKEYQKLPEEIKQGGFIGKKKEEQLIPIKTPAYKKLLKEGYITTENGWGNQFVQIKGAVPQIIKDKGIELQKTADTTLESLAEGINKKAVPVEIGLQEGGYGKPTELVKFSTEEGKDIYVNKEYVNMVLKQYPDAQFFGLEENRPLVAKKGEEIVGVIMPIQEGKIIKGEAIKPQVGEVPPPIKPPKLPKEAVAGEFEPKPKFEKEIQKEREKFLKQTEKETLPKIPTRITPETIGVKPKAEIIQKREDILLRMKLRAEARGAKRSVKQYRKEQIFFEMLNRKIIAELNKPKGLQRSVVSFVKQLGEFNQTVMNEIKTELGIKKPIKEMNLIELKDFTQKLKERLKFKFEKGYQPSIETKEKLNLKESPKPILNEVDYEKNRQLVRESKSTKKEINKIVSKTGEGMEKILTPISTRLENIDPSLKYTIRKFEFDVMSSIRKDKLAIIPFLKKIRTGIFGRMTKDDFADLDLALKNGDINKITEINKKYGIEKEYNDVHKVLDNIYKRANEVGFDIGYQRDYFPRVIKDTEGFLEYFGKQKYWSILDEAIKRKEMDLGRYLTNEEKANLINTMIRGFERGKIALSETGAMKERVIDLVTPELNNFYYDSPTSLVKYISEVNDKIISRKFFGKGNKMEGFNNIEDSIGAYTTDLLAKGKITPKQELELRNMLNARFNPRGTHGIVGLYKNLAYIDVMGSFLNAITQLGDQTWAIYRGGLWETIKADVRGIFGKSKITKESLGIEAKNIASEFSDTRRIARVLDKVFTLTGLNKIDRLGKEALVNSAIKKYQKLAENPTIDFLKMIDNIFGKESEQVLIDLKNGEITENVKLLAFNELLDFHPIALSEMPETYLKGGNSRIFYMLKSYILKQFDIFRREAFREMKRGNVRKGIRNLLYLSMLVIITNGTADEIKDLLTNRKTKLSDRVIDQLATLSGFSRYSMGKISEIGLGSALIKQIIPPTNFVDNLSKDLMNLYKDFDKSADINQLRTVQDIPFIGKFYYWWFGKGRKSIEPEKPVGGIDFGFEKGGIQGIEPLNFNF